MFLQFKNVLKRTSIAFIIEKKIYVYVILKLCNPIHTTSYPLAHTVIRNGLCVQSSNEHHILIWSKVTLGIKQIATTQNLILLRMPLWHSRAWENCLRSNYQSGFNLILAQRTSCIPLLQSNLLFTKNKIVYKGDRGFFHMEA
jgi:hypothetical protein